MRSKTPLALMEQMVMVLVFALAAALCLQVFAFSSQTSRRNEAVDQAVTVCQNAAEIIKAAGNADVLISAAGAQKVDESTLEAYYTEDWETAGPETGVYRLQVQERNSEIPGLGTALISVDTKNGQDLLFSLTVAWQEVTDNA